MVLSQIKKGIFYSIFVTLLLNASVFNKESFLSKVTNTFLIQGWEFFAPNPAINTTRAFLICISETEEKEHIELSSALKKNKEPLSYLLPSNNHTYIIQSYLNQISKHFPSSLAKSCKLGSCDDYFNAIMSNYAYQELESIGKIFCRKNYKNSIGHRLEFSIRNTPVFSEYQKAKKIQYLNDLIKLPANEYKD